MKKKLQLLILLLACGVFSQVSAQRFLSEIFSDVTVTTDVVYGNNISVLTGMPVAQDLKMDVYEPVGDTASNRPVVLYLHTGSFLPVPVNGGTTGFKEDSATVTICTQMAKRGYVAMAVSYRLGWNPASTSQDVRTGTLLNAAYRGIQDVRTAARFLRKDVATNNNTFGIDDTKIIVIGQGTGGYISYGAVSLDKYSEITLPKFLDVNAQSYVDTTLSGDAYGFGGTALNNDNHPGYSSDIQFAISLGGAVGDSTWIEAGDAPTVAFQCTSDPFAPYKFGAVIVPTTQQFVVNVSGAHDIMRLNNALGNNSCYATPAANWTDPYTTAANAINDGHEGLFPFQTASPQSAPWEWWDTSAVNNANSLLTNPDMSKAKALAYIDTIMNYSNPRIVACLGLDTGIATGVYDDALNAFLTVSPNPATSQMEIALNNTSESIQVLELRDLQGKLLRKVTGINGQQYVLDRAGLQTGLYLLTILSDNGKTTRKVLFD